MSNPSLLAAVTASPSEGDQKRLHGRWLMLARVGWVVVTLTIVVLNIIAFQDIYGSNFTYTPTVLQELPRLGLSPTLYGVLLTAESAPLQLVYLALGLLLFWRRSNDRMALFCSFAFITFGNANPFYDFTSGDIVPSLASNALLRAVALVLWAMGNSSLVIFFYLFPSGRFVPRWTRWAALLVAAYWLAVIFFPTLPSNAGGPATYLIPIFLVSAAVAQVYRYRRVSTPRERQQTKWAVFGFALAMLLFTVYIPVGIWLVPSSIKDDPVLGNLNPFFTVALPLIPIFIAIAILRSHLWDIDAIINKALVYGSLTGLLGALYAGLIIGLESLAGGIVGKASQQPVVLVVSTLAIAALFQPARKRLQATIDRRFYRRKYDAEQTLAAFSATLRNEVDMNQLREHLLTVINETMQPAHASLWLRPVDGSAQQPVQAGKDASSTGTSPK